MGGEFSQGNAVLFLLVGLGSPGVPARRVHQQVLRRFQQPMYLDDPTLYSNSQFELELIIRNFDEFQLSLSFNSYNSFNSMSKEKD